MPGSTGPDLNTYTIPEVQLGDTFNVWRDATNTAIYKLNKLKIYDANTSTSTSIGATYTTAGVWTAYMLPTITTGHTFTNLIQFNGGISGSSGFTLGGSAWVVGGVSLGGTLTVGGAATLNGNVVLGDTNGDTITVNGVFGNGLTATGAIRANAGLTATTLDVSGVSKFVGSGSFIAGLSASAVYASAGSTFASNLHVGGGFTANGNTVLNGTLKVAGAAVLSSTLNVSAATQLGTTLNVVGVSTLAGLTATTLDVSGAARILGGLSAASLYASTGSTFGGSLYVGGGVSAASTLDVVGNTRLGYNATGATFGVSGSVFLQARAPLKFGDSTSAKWVGFQAPTTVTTTTVWTLPAADGGGGQVLSTNAAGVLAWKSADGVTGTDKQIQFNMGGTLGATAGLVFEYNTAGYSAGTLGVSGGAYIMGNVGIGITTPAISSRLFAATDSTTKLEVRGDIRIPSGGFFVTKNTSISTATTVTIAADENAFFCGTVVVASGATLSIASGGSLVIL